MLSKHVKLTKKIIDGTLYPEKGQVFLRDTELKGFALRITKGQKTFILEKFVNGRCMRLTIGPYGVFTVEMARNKAIELSSEIIKGNDPAQDKLFKREEMTFEELAVLFTERHVSSKSENTQEQYGIILKIHLSGFNKRKLSAISRGDVARLHAEMGKDRPYIANRTIAVLRKIFNDAKTWGVFKGDNPAAGIKMFREEKRDRFIHPDEIIKLNTALMKELDPYTRAAFVVMLFTGQRKTEVLTMKWQDLDFTLGIWHLPQTKAGRPHNVPIPSNIETLLHSLPKMLNNPYVFVGRDGTSHLKDIKGAWDRIRSRSGLQDLRPHDLRRTLGSWLAISGESLPLIGKVLNHSQPSTTAIYARLSLDPVRAALEANSKRMLAIMGQVPEGNGNE